MNVKSTGLFFAGFFLVLAGSTSSIPTALALLFAGLTLAALSFQL